MRLPSVPQVNVFLCTDHPSVFDITGNIDRLGCEERSELVGPECLGGGVSGKKGRNHVIPRL